jgi:hypothetical protein
VVQVGDVLLPGVRTREVFTLSAPSLIIEYHRRRFFQPLPFRKQVGMLDARTAMDHNHDGRS